MGQGQSQQEQQEHPATLEANVSAEEQAQARVEMRAKQQAALDRRLASQQRKSKPAADEVAKPSSVNKRPTALEQMSKENLGWRNADAQADLRRWN
ncbi:hypothetical protein FB567DRAFT_629976 [Paraphoma chrysanthemicola]|uniref:Uncharacterized protein n=1 Tax=Paraphoma chrysanthemicola TaxID=798071 RepID=A0A8K0VX56_9PLEO|nr:hypothetical protein FB567DRAFT_629976 [Paraphoma chrysanthemicola]